MEMSNIESKGKKLPHIITAVVISIILIIAGQFYYSHEAELIRVEKYNYLKTVAQLKINQIEHWRSEKIIDAHILSKRITWREVLTSRSIQQRANYLSEISIQFDSILDKYDFDGIALITPDSKILLSSNLGKTELNSTEYQYIDSTLKFNKQFIRDFYFNKDKKKINLDLYTPILGAGSKPAGVLLLHINPANYLFPLVQSWPDSVGASETLLIRKEGDNVIFLNELKKIKGAALQLKFPLTRTDIPAVKAILGYKGIFEGVDYVNEPVLSYVTPIPNTAWYMVAKVDKTYIFSELKYRAVVIGLFVIILIAISSISISALYNIKRKKIFLKLYNKEVELKKVEDEFRITLYSIGDAVISTDSNGLIRHMNRVAEELCGWKLKEAEGRHLTDVFNIINAQTREKVTNPVNIVMETGKVVGLANHTVLISKDGSERQISDSAAPILDSNGKILGVVLVFSDVTNSYLIQEDLRNSEKLLRESQFVAGIGSYVMDVYSGNWNSSEALDNIFGINKSFNKNVEGWVSMIHPDFQEIMADYLKDEVIGKRKKFDKEYKLLRPSDGKEIWVHGMGDLEIDENGNVIKMIGTIQDITERKLYEHELLQSEKRFRSIVEGAPDPIFIQLDGRFAYCNPECLKLFEAKDATEVIGKNVIEMFHKDYYEVIRERIKQLNESKHPVKKLLESKLISLKGNEYWVETSGTPIHYKLKDGALVFLRDITEKYEARELLKRNEENLRITLNSIGDGVISTDSEGIITNMNPVAERMCGWNIADAVGKPLSEVFEIINVDTREKVENPVKYVIEKGEVVGLANHTVLIDKSGNERQISDSAAPIKNSDGKIIGVVLVFSDVTEEYAMQKKLRDNEARLIKAELFGKFGNWELDLVNKTMYASTGAREIYGFHGLSWDLEKVQKVPQPEYREMMNKALNDLITMNVPYDIEFKINRLTDNEERYIHSTASYNSNLKKVFGVISDVTDRKLSEEALLYSEQKFNIAFQSSPIAMSIQNSEDDVFLDINDAFLEMLGYNREEVLGKHGKFLNLWADENERNSVHEIYNSKGFVDNAEFRFRRKNGSIGVGIFSIEQIIINGKKADLTTVLDITERKEAQNTILNALNEKEILLKEIHHRVKNNFQIITSLLSLQENMITDKAVLDIFDDSQNRIKSMALIHELMYRTENFSALNLKDYVFSLVEHLKLSFSSMHDKISIQLDVDDIQLDMDDLIPNGLILNELVSNAYKHAFPGSKSGIILVSFKQFDQDKFSLSVIDDGIGLKNEPDFNEPKTLGLFLVTTLVKQLKGDLQINDLKPGTEFKINFTRAKQ